MSFKTGTTLLTDSPKKSLSHSFTKTETDTIKPVTQAKSGKNLKGIDLDIASSINTSPTKLDYLLNNAPRKRLGLSRSAKTPSLHKP